MSSQAFMEMAANYAMSGILENAGGPFGCAIVKDNKVVGIGHNEVLKNNDPTCHGEIQAIRMACKVLKTYDLSGCELYTTAYPCPMCLGAIQWARISKVYYGCTIEDTQNIGFDDKDFYENNQIEFIECSRDRCLDLFNIYKNMNAKRY